MYVLGMNIERWGWNLFVVLESSGRPMVIASQLARAPIWKKGTHNIEH